MPQKYIFCGYFMSDFTTILNEAASVTCEWQIQLVFEEQSINNISITRRGSGSFNTC